MLLILGPHWDPLVYMSKDDDFFKKRMSHIFRGKAYRTQWLINNELESVKTLRGAKY